MAPRNASFEGKLSADGNSIVGTFTQGVSLPLTLERASKDSAWALPAPPRAMAADAPTTFEVATIRPVVDQTGLQGRFDFTLNWTPDEGQFRGIPIPPANTDPNAPPGLFTAIQEQIGIKMDRMNAQVEVIVIDKVERPSEN